MIFITNQNMIVNISKNKFTRDIIFYDAVHIALFKKPLALPNYTNTIIKTINNYHSTLTN